MVRMRECPSPPLIARFFRACFRPSTVLCVPGTLPVALASLMDKFDRIDRCTGLDKGLNLSPNPWQHPPEAIVAGGMPAVRGYFEAIFRGGTTVVTRPLKVVIIGKETVGKTRYEGTACWSFHFPGSCTIDCAGFSLLPHQ